MEPKEVLEALNTLGVSKSSVDQIRLGRGVVGKSSYVAGSAVLALGVAIAAVRDPTFSIIGGCLIGLIFFVYFIGIIRFANKHPGLALLDGAELIQWRQMDMAVKGGLEKAPNDKPRQIGKAKG